MAILAVLGHGTWQAVVASGIANWARGQSAWQFFALRETEYAKQRSWIGSFSTNLTLLPNAAADHGWRTGLCYAIIESPPSRHWTSALGPQACGDSDSRWRRAYPGREELGLTLYRRSLSRGGVRVQDAGDGLRDELDRREV